MDQKERSYPMLRLARLLAIPLTAVLLFTGCQVESPVTDKGDTEKAEPPKKLTTREVIAKSQQMTDKVEGFTYKVEGDQKISLEAGGQSQGIDQKLDMDAKVSNNPNGIHISGTVVGGGQSNTMEVYQVGDEIYQKLDGVWVKGKGADLNEVAGGQVEDPSKALQKLEEMVAKFKGDQDSPFEMKETDDQYIISLNVTEDQKEMKDLMMKQLAGALVPALKQAGLSINEGDIKLNSLEQVHYINKKTFEQEKTDQTMKLEIPIQEGGESGVIKTEQSTTQTMTGKFDGRIEVPQEVKDNAKEISM